ncbi:MAG: tryptophan synthase subunit alpha [bacterium]|nr:tryptophan synthase subunit alpha [bacterium]
MSAIAEVFARCREQGRAAFIPFLIAGDPDLKTTAELMQALVAGGADLIELGVPFSDPIADGRVIQRAICRSLAAGTRLSGVLQLVARHRDQLKVPILLCSYFNPIHARGVEDFAEQASASGVDGVLCVDLPPEEGVDEFIPTMRGHGLDTVFVLAPASTKERIRMVGEVSTGFVYHVSRIGARGESDELPKELLKEAKRLRRRLSAPLALGYNISTPRQVAALAGVADGVGVGTALASLIEKHTDDPDLAVTLEKRVRELAEPLGR